MDDKELTSWTVFGERGSGTRWVSNMLGKATLMENLSDSFISGWKHGLWTPRAESNLGKHNLVVVVKKDLYAWLLSFYQKPWHCQHLTSGKSFSEFIRSEYWAKINDTKHKEWWGMDDGEEFPERDGRWSNPIQMWRDKYLSYEKVLESEDHPSILVEYLSLLNHPEKLLEYIEKLGGRVVNTDFPDPKRNYDKFQYYNDHLYMELYSKEDIKFVKQELEKPSELFG